MNENDNFALVPKPPSAIEKAEPGAKRILSGMVADTLALVKREQARKTRPPSIVIVDDEEVTRYLYKHLLKNWGKETTLQEFKNSDDAWKELSQTDPDLLITRIPVSGRFLLPLLAEKKVKYPILVTSAFFSEEEVRERAGPSLNVSFLPLPFTAQQFYQELLIHFGPSDNPQAQVLKSHPVSILFSAEHIIPNLKAKERFAAIREMVARLISLGQIKPQDEKIVLDAIIKRENSMSTGLGFGIAIPRGRVDCVKDIILAVGISSSGVEFDAIDEQPVYVSVLSVSPANSQSHEATLQKVTESLGRFLQTNDGVGQLRRCNSAEQIWSILKPIYDDALTCQADQSVWREFELKWRLGARTAALIIKLTNQFVSRIEFSCGKEVADAKSIMGVMMVFCINGTDAECGCRFKVSATGTDAAAAIDALTELFTCGSRVDRCIEPSCPLKPALAGYTHDMISYGCKNGHTWSVRRLNES